MSNPNPSNILFSTRYKYYLNYDTKVGSVDIPSTSYGAGTAKSYSIVIPLERTDDVSNIKVNFSHIGGVWFNFPPADLELDSNFDIASTGSYSSSNLTLTFYIVNQTGLTVSNTALTVTAEVALFVTPYDIIQVSRAGANRYLWPAL